MPLPVRKEAAEPIVAPPPHENVAMKPNRPRLTPLTRLWCLRSLVAMILCGTVLAAHSPAPAVPPAAPPASIPPAAIRPVDFARDIAPILQDSCAQCHANGRSKGGLKLDTRDNILKGGETGPAVTPGQSGKSLLIELVSGKDPDRMMPKKGHPLSVEEIGLLRAWIDAGLTWPQGFVLSKWKQAPLAPRRPAIPAAAPGSGLTSPIDLILQDYFVAHHVKPAAPVNDRVFARRVYLDVIGLLPPPAELDAFAADRSPDKRDRLVQTLLADDARYAEHWMSFWNDLLRNDYRGAGYIDGGRKQITPWLYHALATNMPYDQFVRELATGADGADGFTKGIVWRGVVNAAQTPQMQAAQNISQVFEGVNLKCASCHDSFISDWKLADSYGLAGVYADGPLTMERCNVPQNEVAPPHFLYPQLGTIDAKAAKAVRVKQLADLITSPQNGRLARTVVNRLWQKFLGRGLVEPADEMDNDPWNADVLDYLASDLADNHYDLKKTMGRILTSRAYQLPAVVAKEETASAYVFAGPAVRRMSAEEFVDAVAALTGVPAGTPAVKEDGTPPTPPAKPPAKPAAKTVATASAKLGAAAVPGATPGILNPATAPAKPQAAEEANPKPLAASRQSPPVRAVFCPADPLTTALGRPSREQVVTERPSAATTLQGLEMTNGHTLATLLRKGAEKLAADKTLPPRDLVLSLYAKAYGRPPTPAELQDALAPLGSPVKVEAVEDLLWVMVMLPEFQLIQ